MENLNDTEYKGYYITHNAYGKNEYTVQCDGDDCYFDSEDDAKKFIDEITEDHFDDKEDGIEPEDPGYDEDEVLNEDDPVTEGRYTVRYRDYDTGEEMETTIFCNSAYDAKHYISPLGDVIKVYESKESSTTPYTTKDLADGIVDILENFDTMDWDTGSYDYRDTALEDLINLSVFDEMPEDDIIEVTENLDFEILRDFIIKHPDQAELMFKTVASVFGYKNYSDYRSYVDYIQSDEYDQYLKDIQDDFDNLKMGERIGRPAFTDEAINTGAIVNTPGKHILIDMDEDEVDDNE